MNSRRYAFAQLFRRPVDLNSLRWVLGGLLAIAIDVEARAAGLEDYQSEIVEIDDETAEVRLTKRHSDSVDGEVELAEGEDGAELLLALPGESTPLPAEIRKLLLEIALANPVESERLLTEFREQIVAQQSTKKIQDGAGAKSSNDSKAPAGSDVPSNKLLEAIREAAAEIKGSGSDLKTLVDLSDLGELIPLQFVEEDELAIIWHKDDGIGVPWWALTPLLALGGGGGGGGPAPAPTFSLSGLLLEDRVSNATLLIEVKTGSVWTEATVYGRVTSDINGAFKFNTLDSSIIAQLQAGTARIHALPFGVDTYTKNTVGDFYLTFTGQANLTTLLSNNQKP